MDNNTGNQNLEDLTFKPGNYEAQRCPVCKGFGTVNYGEKTCQSCDGRGMVYVPKRAGVPEYRPAKNIVNTKLKSGNVIKR